MRCITHGWIEQMDSLLQRSSLGNIRARYLFIRSITHSERIEKETIGNKSPKVKFICSELCLYLFVSYTLVLAKKKFKIKKEEYESITNMGGESALNFLFHFYEFLTGEKIDVERRLSSTLSPPEEPLYKKPTASFTVKDRELERIVDKKMKETKINFALTEQKRMITTQKYNSGLIEWLIRRRKQEVEAELEKQNQDRNKNTRSFANSDAKVEVREIELKCFNSSTNKKIKGGEYGEFFESKGAIGFLTESCTALLKKDSVIADLKRIGIEQKDLNNNMLEELFKKCGEHDTKGVLKVSSETLISILEICKKTSEVTLVVDNIFNNVTDYNKYFEVFLKPLKFYDRDSEVFRLLLSVLTSVARGLKRTNPLNAEVMFLDLLLVHLLKIGENTFKRTAIATLALEFMRNTSECYSNLIQRLKEIYRGQLRTFVGYLAQMLEPMSRNCDELNATLWSEFMYYGFQSLSSPSPLTRASGTKILANLFTEVVVASNEIITDKLTQLGALVTDSWWEVRAQALIIFKAILLSHFNNPSVDIDSTLNTKTLFHYILEIFKPNISHNVLRIGLVELAPLLIHEPSLCGRYLEILLHVNAQVRAEVLNIAVIKVGPVVYGANTFYYKLSGAPLVWNSLELAKALSNYLKTHSIDVLTQPHLEILDAAITQNGAYADLAPEWLNFYQQFKLKIFHTLENEELCEVAASIIRKFVEVDGLRETIIQNSKSELGCTLTNVYSQETSILIKNNLLNLFRYFHEQESELTYKIVKEFAETNKKQYLASNLVEFMNDLTRLRRKKLFPES